MRYDAGGNRVYKSLPGGTSTYYLNDPTGKTIAVLDVSGNIKMLNFYGLDNFGYMTISYEQQYIPPPPDCISDPTFVTQSENLLQTEQLVTDAEEVTTSTPAPDPCVGSWITVHVDRKYYSLKDHLCTIKMTVDANGNVTSYDDYYPYGMVMEGRSGNFGQGEKQ